MSLREKAQQRAKDVIHNRAEDARKEAEKQLAAAELQAAALWPDVIAAIDAAADRGEFSAPLPAIYPREVVLHQSMAIGSTKVLIDSTNVQTALAPHTSAGVILIRKLVKEGFSVRVVLTELHDEKDRPLVQIDAHFSPEPEDHPMMGR